MKVAAIVPAAGKGKRINSKIAKPYIKLFGKPIIAHTLIRLSRNKHICEIVVAVDRKKANALRREVIDRYCIKNVKIVSGGRERSDSVFNALRSVSSNVDYILVHDCVRPFITDNLINSSLSAAKRFGASVVGIPLKPTLKYAGKGGHVLHTLDRKNFWEAQTPQAFKKDLLERAYKKRGRKRNNITDDSMLVERLGIKPKLVMGSYSNIKITTQEDLALAKVLYHHQT